MFLLLIALAQLVMISFVWDKAEFSIIGSIRSIATSPNLIRLNYKTKSNK
jgi:hypothetical protein